MRHEEKNKGSKKVRKITNERAKERKKDVREIAWKVIKSKEVYGTSHSKSFAKKL